MNDADTYLRSCIESVPEGKSRDLTYVLAAMGDIASVGVAFLADTNNSLARQMLDAQEDALIVLVQALSRRGPYSRADFLGALDRWRTIQANISTMASENLEAAPGETNEVFRDRQTAWLRTNTRTTRLTHSFLRHAFGRAFLGETS